MGNSWTRELRDGTAQSPNSVTPKQDSPPTFDPMLGFPSGRVPRVMTVSAEEMEAVQLQPWEKNYCADLHVKVDTAFLMTGWLQMNCFWYRLKFATTRILPLAGGAATSSTRWTTA